MSEQLTKVTGMHCCSCEQASAVTDTAQQKAQLEADSITDFLSAAGQLLTAEYRSVGDRPTAACAAAESFLVKAFRKAELAFGADVKPTDPFTLGGTYRG